ncbi:MAG TPA: DUF3866 family protein [Solirubrobacterales bacterium]|nr:DUF3866 family protein [Solirubrobacterales bacterium]
MSGRLKLRRGMVVSAEPLTVEVDGEQRAAWADTTLLGEMHEGDEVVVNVEALDLGLGSGGFDVVHVNLTRGLEGAGLDGEHVMKLNYSSLQHAVEPVEGRNALSGHSKDKTLHPASPVLVLPLHGYLAPAAWAAERVSAGLKVGYVQTAGGALPGSLSRDLVELRERNLLCGHITAAPAYGGEHEAISVAGALDAAARELEWDAIIAGPGPGIIGSDSRLGHGGMAALDTAHASLALALPTLLSPRLSAADPRERHRSVSHHTLTVMQLLLGGVEVPVPSSEPVSIAVLATAAGWRHHLHEAPVDLKGYEASGLSVRTMGRTLQEDPLFFMAALASGRALAESTAGGVGGGGSRT